MRRYLGSTEKWVEMLQSASEMEFQTYLHEVTENGPMKSKGEPDHVCYLKRTLLGLEETQHTWLTLVPTSVLNCLLGLQAHLAPGPLLPYSSSFFLHNPVFLVIYSLGSLGSPPSFPFRLLQWPG